MKKNILKKFVVLLSLGFILFSYNFTLAEDTTPPADVTPPVVVTPPADVPPPVDNTTPPAPANNNFSVNTSITAPDHCSIKDISGKDHTFPQEGSPSKYLGICALVEAKTQGAISNLDIVGYSFGLFVDSINGLKDPSSAYWALYLNDTYEESRGLVDLPIVAGDKVSLVYVDFDTKPLGSRVDINISALASSGEKQEVVNIVSGGGGSYVPVKEVNKIFSIKNAFDFLSKNHKSDGSFGAPLYTDWVSIAAAAGDNENLKSSLSNYIKSNSINGDMITDYERRAMALMALGINPYTGTEVNYIKKITDGFDGVQFGDKTLVNDDIFALIVLNNAGFGPKDEMITKDINYIISKQDKDGSWGSIDMTAAGMEALKSLKDVAGVADSIQKAEKYITTNQKLDGGFENSSSTSWVLQNLFDNKEILKGEVYLASKQEVDGGMEKVDSDLNNRIWATSYAIPAILHRPWSAILNIFPKQDVTVNNSISNGSIKQKTVYKKWNKQEGGVVKSAEDKKKIENIIDSNGNVKSSGKPNIWHVFKAPFTWFFGKLGF